MAAKAKAAKPRTWTQWAIIGPHGQLFYVLPTRRDARLDADDDCRVVKVLVTLAPSRPLLTPPTGEQHR